MMHNALLIFAWVWAAMIANSFWEAYAEGRNAWDKGKLGWKLRLGKYYLTAYHFYLFWVMYPLLLTLPLVIYGFNARLLGILISAYASGMVIQDLFWYIVNPAVKFAELWSPFSDYYPWIRIAGKKIIPLGYAGGVAVAVLSWYFLWR